MIPVELLNRIVLHANAIADIAGRKLDDAPAATITDAMSPRELRELLGVITEDELFSILGISLGTGRNRQAARSLPPHYKVGAVKLYNVDEVKAWMRSCRRV